MNILTYIKLQQGLQFEQNANPNVTLILFIINIITVKDPKNMQNVNPAEYLYHILIANYENGHFTNARNLPRFKNKFGWFSGLFNFGLETAAIAVIFNHLKKQIS